MPDDQVANDSNTIILSKHTKPCLIHLKLQKRNRPDDISALSVSQTVSFFALVYEKSEMLLSTGKII